MQIVVGEGGCTKSSVVNSVLDIQQGSHVSDALFSILLNDRRKAIEEAEIHIYADDVIVVGTATNLQDLE